MDLKTLHPDGASWPKPSLTILRGTTLGAADFTAYFPARALIGADGKPLAPRPMEDQFDAVLYLGPPSDITMSLLPPDMCADAAYMEMRMRRIKLMALPGVADRVKEHCAALTRP